MYRYNVSSPDVIIVLVINNKIMIQQFVRRRNMSMKSLQGRRTTGSRDECRTAPDGRRPLDQAHGLEPLARLQAAMKLHCSKLYHCISNMCSVCFQSNFNAFLGHYVNIFYFLLISLLLICSHKVTRFLNRFDQHVRGIYALDCILTFSLGLSVPTLRRFCRLRYDVI